MTVLRSRRGGSGVRAVEGDLASPGAGEMRSVVGGLEQEHGQSLFGFCRRIGLDDDGSADVVQESLLRLLDAFEAGKRIVDPRAWLFTVTYRLAMDEHRRRGRSARLEIGWSERPGPSVDPVEHSELSAVWAEVDRLPERQRAALYLRYRADLPFEAIGRVMGITSSAARSHATQALATLRGRLWEDL